MKENLLIQLLEDGFITGEVKVGKTSKVIGTVKTLTVADQLEIDKVLENAEKENHTNRKTVQLYAKKAMARALVEFNGVKITSTEQAEELLDKSSSQIMEVLVRAQSKLEEDLKKLLTYEVLEETFTEEDSGKAS